MIVRTVFCCRDDLGEVIDGCIKCTSCRRTLRTVPDKLRNAVRAMQAIGCEGIPIISRATIKWKS
jgi:hypothetical protein